MNDWLDVMLEEIARKKREAEEAQAELERRKSEADRKPAEGRAPKSRLPRTQSK